MLIDWVPNHSSDQHPWFLDARSGRDAEHRDWYYWRNEPNNWRSAIDLGSAWTLDEKFEQYYLHFFLPQQPDLNWTNPQVVDAMHDTLRFWLARGVDGFRIDSVQCLGKYLSFSDNDRSLSDRTIDRALDDDALPGGLYRVLGDSPTPKGPQSIVRLGPSKSRWMRVVSDDGRPHRA